MKRILDFCFFWLQWLLIILVLPSLSAPYISPEFSTIPAFTNLLFPILFIAMLIVFIYGLIRLKISFVPIFILMLFSWSGFQKTFAFNIADSQKASANHINIMSFNAKNFGRNHSDSIKEQHINLIRKESPDILCLQEFHIPESKSKKYLNSLQQALQLDHQYLKPTDFNKNGAFYGIALFSRHPIIDQGYVDFQDHNANGILYSDLKLSNDTVRIINAHLQSVKLITRPMQEDHNELTALFQKDFFQKVERLRAGFIKRVGQVKHIEKLIEESDHPVIFCGDFNDTPLSYSYQQIRNSLNDGFLEGGWGFGSSYAGPLPLLRIDYIMLDEFFQVSDFQVIEQELSDHHPIICRINLP